jgi:hypothetical protein
LLWRGRVISESIIIGKKRKKFQDVFASSNLFMDIRREWDEKMGFHLIFEVESKSFKMNNIFFSLSRFLPRMSTSFPFNTSIMYKKTVFVEYKDQLFNIAKPRPPWMGNENNIEC